MAVDGWILANHLLTAVSHLPAGAALYILLGGPRSTRNVAFGIVKAFVLHQAFCRSTPGAVIRTMWVSGKLVWVPVTSL